MNRRKNNSTPGLIPACLKKLHMNAEKIILLLTGFFVLSLATCVSLVESSGFKRINLNDFKVGTIAERDVVLPRDLSYIDENATEIRRNARLNLVTAVFRYFSTDSGTSPESTALSLNQINFFEFLHYIEKLRMDSSDAVTNSLEVQESYPGTVSLSVLESFFSLPPEAQSEILRFTSAFFNAVNAKGLAAFPDKGLEQFSKTEVEVVRGNERITVPKSSLLTRENLSDFLNSEVFSAGLNSAWEKYVLAFVVPFLKENLIFQSDESEAKIQLALESVSPVLVVIPKGEKIVRRGFVITEESYSQLEYLSKADVKINKERFLATVLVLFISMVASVFMLSLVSCKELGFFRYQLFLMLCFAIVYVSCLVFSHIQVLQRPLNYMLVLPVAFFAMLAAILLNKIAAIIMVFIFSAGVFCASSFMPEPVLFSIFSGMSAVAVIRDTGKRLDLVRSAGFLAVMSAVSSFIITVVYTVSFPGMSFYVMGAAVNGFLSGILVIGFLPLLENLLNAVTSFRLMELSDLNTSLMQKMLLTVPGTYNHSQMVASLAENACRAIGANSLLARVGAYYHDIGKMEQGEYFVENQTGENKHSDLAPRLSATIIRSHVKQGLEKARNLKLPQEVIDIISEHHGNSVISYFYNKSKEENPETDPEDFMYPGNPPRSKESAVVMLADTVEAACRSLEKPSAPRLEKFIDELVKAKIEHGQLKDSDLTFRDLGVIKQTFVNILAGYYHTRIEYPNQKDPDEVEKNQDKEKVKETAREIVREITKETASSGGVPAAKEAAPETTGDAVKETSKTGKRGSAAGKTAGKKRLNSGAGVKKAGKGKSE